jgi:predicted phage terminase large subunit-like protein
MATFPDLLRFAHAASRGAFLPYFHAGALANIFMRLACGASRRVLLAAPPRHSKTSAFAVYGAPWYLLGNPSKQYVYAAHSATFAEQKGSQARDVFAESAPLYGHHLSETSFSAGRWAVSRHGGSMRSVGVGTAVMGEGIDLLCIDDPIPGAAEAASQAFKDQLWEWFSGTLINRLNPDAGVLVFHQRFATDDLIGRILERMTAGGPAWEYHCWPVIAEDHDPLGRPPGGLLWPDVWPLHKLQEKWADSTQFWIEAQYGQRPTVLGGNHFKADWFKGKFFTSDGERYYPSGRDSWARHQCPVFVTADLAASEKTSANFTVFLAAAVTPRRDMLLLDVERKRHPIDRIVPALLQFCQRHGPSWCGIEADGFQAAIAQEAMRTPGMPPVRLLKTASRSKLVRATDAILMAERGQIFTPEVAPWKEAFLSELCAFTGDDKKDRYDDQVDVLSWGAIEHKRARFEAPSFAGSKPAADGHEERHVVHPADVLRARPRRASRLNPFVGRGY